MFKGFCKTRAKHLELFCFDTRHGPSKDLQAKEKTFRTMLLVKPDMAPAASIE